MSLIDDLAIVILAAGKGTRMKSDLPKVLHPLNAKSMILYVVDCAVQVAGSNVVVVVGHQAEKVKNKVQDSFTVSFAHQKELMGTGDAVLTAMPKIGSSINKVLVLYGDVPLIKKETLLKFIDEHQANNYDLSILAANMDNPTGYGRIIADSNGQVRCIREEADATEDEKKIKEINTGIYCFDKLMLTAAINQIKPDNKQSEYYLTDVVEIARKCGSKIGVINLENYAEVMGINTPEELKKAEDFVKQKLG